MSQFFNETQLRNYKVNFKDVFRVSNKTENSDSNYEFDIEYENDVVRIIKQEQMIDDLFDFEFEK